MNASQLPPLPRIDGWISDDIDDIEAWDTDSMRGYALLVAAIAEKAERERCAKECEALSHQQMTRLYIEEAQEAKRCAMVIRMGRTA